MADLHKEIALLLRGGCEIHIVSKISPYGTIYADVKVVPPPREPLPIQDETLLGPLAPRFPVVSTFHVYYDIDRLADFLHSARVFILR